MTQFENKLAAIMNKSAEPGIVMNALAHACLGLGANLGREPLELITYRDASGNSYPNISKMPFIIVQANSNKIRATVEQARSKGVQWVAFTSTMTVGSWEEQVERTEKTAIDDLEFYGVILFGPWNTVSELTRKFSLWR